MDVFAAIACDDAAELARILQADPKAGEQKNSTGHRALHYAVAMDRIEMVKSFLDKGCDPDVRSAEKNSGLEGETALLSAAFWGRPEIAAMLIEHGASVNAKAKGDVTPLHEAARMRQVEIIEQLLQHGANVNAKDSEGQTPLDWAGGDKAAPEIAELLSKQ
jgi:cytohesin